jgi:glycosyltransferase involved in cell wall biosynthesis
MKILMLSEDFLPNIGGITSHIVYLSEALVKAGHEVAVLKPGQESTISFFDERGFEIVYFRKHVFNKLALHAFIGDLVKTRGFDVVHWHQLVGYETKFLPRVAKIFTNHTSMYLEQYEYARKRLALKIMLSHVDAIISPSRELEQKSAFLNPRLGNYYVPNGVDERRFIAARLLKDEVAHFADVVAQKKAGKTIILCPRRLEPKCGVNYFIESLPFILDSREDVCGVIAGRGGFFEEEKKLKSWLSARGIADRVLFLGDVKNTDMPALYALSDLVVFPSLMEATSISCLEAMSCAKPIVATNVGGLPELISDGVNGFLVEPRSSNALASSLLELMKSPQLAEQFGRASRAHVEDKFTWRSIAHQTVQIYQNAVDFYARSHH